MKERTGNLFEETGDAICITTNGAIKCNGCGVMGAGVAKEAAIRYPQLPKKLGSNLKQLGNHVNILDFIIHPTPSECKCPKYTYIVAFPVKHMWYDNADLTLIEQSCKELVAMADRIGWQNVSLPRPGCMNGKLEWATVKPICEKYFDDRFTIVDINGDK